LNSVPTFAAYADAKNGNALKALYDNKKQLKLGKNEDIIQLGENEYVYKSRATNVFFGIRKFLPFISDTYPASLIDFSTGLLILLYRSSSLVAYICLLRMPKNTLISNLL